MVEIGAMDTLPVVIAKRARATPDRTFLVEVGGDTLTYGQAHMTFLAWAAALCRAGVEPGERVAVMLPTSLIAVAAWVGAAWAGALEVPVNTGFRGRMLDYVLSNSGARVLVIADRYVERIRELDLQKTAVELVVVAQSSGELPALGVQVVALEAFLEGAPPLGTLDPPMPWDVATVLYTGGTTGPSKGCAAAVGRDDPDGGALPRGRARRHLLRAVPTVPRHGQDPPGHDGVRRWPRGDPRVVQDR